MREVVSEWHRVGFLSPTPPGGSVAYMPPELLTMGMYGRFTDWWAVGVLAHEIFSGYSPWSSSTSTYMILTLSAAHTRSIDLSFRSEANP